MYSLSEVETTAKKAVRGIGYPWGLAQEAGWAVRWLCQRDIDGCLALTRLLAQIDGQNIDDLTPKLRDGIWTTQGGRMCPVITGAVLSDHVSVVSPQGTRFPSVIEPILLMFFAAQLAHHLQGVVTLHWRDGEAATDGKDVSINCSVAASESNVCLRFGDTLQSPTPIRDRAYPAADSWRVLDEYAQRTYAPISAESRIRGAGPESNY